MRVVDERLVVGSRRTVEAFAVATRVGLPAVVLGGVPSALHGTARVAVARSSSTAMESGPVTASPW